MMEIETALARAHRDNIQRYHKLLKTNLTDVERNYIEELQLRVDANNAQSGVSFMPAVECDGVLFDLHRPPLFGNVGVLTKRSRFWPSAATFI